MKKLGYFGEDEDKLIRFASEEVILEPKEDEMLCLGASSGQSCGSPCTI
jgi:hypothetical protein